MPIFITADVRRAPAGIQSGFILHRQTDTITNIFFRKRILIQIKCFDFKFDFITAIPLIDNFVTTRIHIIRLVFTGDI